MDKTLADTLTANLKSAKTPELAALREAQRQASQTQEVSVVVSP